MMSPVILYAMEIAVTYIFMFQINPNSASSADVLQAL
jgi:hypothetical protein